MCFDLTVRIRLGDPSLERVQRVVIEVLTTEKRDGLAVARDHLEGAQGDLREVIAFDDDLMIDDTDDVAGVDMTNLAGGVLDGACHLGCADGRRR